MVTGVDNFLLSFFAPSYAFPPEDTRISIQVWSSTIITSRTFFNLSSMKQQHENLSNKQYINLSIYFAAWGLGTCDSTCLVFQGKTALKTHKKQSYKQAASIIDISESHLNNIRLCNSVMAFWGVIRWWNSGKKHCRGWYGFLGRTQWKKALCGAIWLFGE